MECTCSNSYNGLDILKGYLLATTSHIVHMKFCKVPIKYICWILKKNQQKSQNYFRLAKWVRSKPTETFKCIFWFKKHVYSKQKDLISENFYLQYSTHVSHKWQCNLKLQQAAEINILHNTTDSVGFSLLLKFILLHT